MKGPFWPLTLSHSDHDRLVFPIAIAVTQSAHAQPKLLKFPISCLFRKDKRCALAKIQKKYYIQVFFVFLYLSSIFLLCRPLLLNYRPCQTQHLTLTTTTNILRATIMSTTDQTKYKLCYFVPPSSLQSTKTAIFATNLAGVFSSLTDASKVLYTNVVSVTLHLLQILCTLNTPFTLQIVVSKARC